MWNYRAIYPDLSEERGAVTSLLPVIGLFSR